MNYEGNTIVYDCGREYGPAHFIPKCPVCGRFVKPDAATPFRTRGDDDFEFGPNATCKQHGHVEMPFAGWLE